MTFEDPDLETCAAFDGQVLGIEVWFWETGVWEMVVCASVFREGFVHHDCPVRPVIHNTTERQLEWL